MDTHKAQDWLGTGVDSSMVNRKRFSEARYASLATKYGIDI